MAGYVPIFRSIVTSTIWGEPPATRCVWFAMLFLADRDGLVEGSVPGLARQAVVTTEECQKALECFLSPDPNSRTEEFDGRRIEKVPGGWQILNFKAYRAKLADMREAEANRLRVERCRQAARERYESPPAPPSEEEIENEEGNVNNKQQTTNPVMGHADDVMVCNGSHGKKSAPEVPQLIQPDWQPSDVQVAALAEKTQAPPERIRACVKDFVFYWTEGNGSGTKRGPKGWAKAFGYRISQLAKFGELYVGPVNGQRSVLPKGHRGPPQPNASDNGATPAWTPTAYKGSES